MGLRWIKHLFSFLIKVIGILQSENLAETLLLANTGRILAGTMDVDHLNSLISDHELDYLFCQFPSDALTPERRIHCQYLSLDKPVDLRITRKHVELGGLVVHHLHNLLQLLVLCLRSEAYGFCSGGLWKQKVVGF